MGYTPQPVLGVVLAAGHAHMLLSIAPPLPVSQAVGEVSDNTGRHRQIGSHISLSCAEVLCPNLLIPLFPPTPEQEEIDATECLMDYLLESLTEQTHWLHWNEPSMARKGFAYLFFLFKLFYVGCLFKDFHKEAGLYTLPVCPPLPVAGQYRHSVGTPCKICVSV